MSNGNKYAGLKKEDLINEAKNYLNDSTNLNADEVNELLGALKVAEQFGYAAEVTIKKNNYEEVPEKEKQGFAKLIYKDHSLPSAIRFGKALAELKGLEKNPQVNTCETYGLKGAIYKRRWEFDGQFKNLLISQKCYLQGYQLWEKSFENPGPYNFKGIHSDFGYTGINTAFVSDLIAIEQLEQSDDALDILDVKYHLCRAIEIRKKIIDKLADKNDQTELEPNLRAFYEELRKKAEEDAKANKKAEGVIDEYFVYATLIEAYFGLFEFDLAKKAMGKMCRLKNINKWKTRSAAKQLIAISQLQEKVYNIITTQNINDADLDLYKKNVNKKAIKDEIISTLLYGEAQPPGATDTSNSSSVCLKPKKGKYGIGLSGGGHRAALYHIGVLASLAENDLLKQVEVISCVSGGSIVGAFYALCVKNLLQQKMDKDITKQDYINIIKYMQVHFKDGVQKNLRSRMFANVLDNIKMMSRKYTRTHKMGEMYEKFFYQKALEYDPMDPFKKGGSKKTEAKEIMMDALIIKPADDPENFDIQYDNWKRSNKVPQLILNATCLNTGHNFQFTAKWMGVPPGNMQPDIDVKPRLRRMYYTEAPKDYRNFRLGYAVASSSCVPFIFRAFPMRDLYEGMDVQLIDGGYHENQGVAAMLDQECKNLIISDGSGQLSSIDTETPSDLSVFYRADVVVQERVRELEFMDIKNRKFSSQLQSISVVHLRKDLTAFPKNWIECKDPPRKLMYSDVTNQLNRTNYGIEKSMQQKISEVRTDLDSFNDTESYMLMYSGYKQMNKEIADLYGITTGADKETEAKNWHFLAMEIPENMEKAKRLMPVSNELFFKAFRYAWRPRAKQLKIAILITALLAAIFVFILFKQEICTFLDSFSLTTLLMATGGIIVAVVALYFWKQILHVALSFVKSVIFGLHLYTTDKCFLKAGKINVKRDDKGR